MRADTTWLDATVRGTRDVTPDIRQIGIVPDLPGFVPTWTPGSHIEVGVVIDGRPDTRCYSRGGAADGACYRIAVKREQPGRGGSRQMRSLAPGARIAATP